MRSREQVIWDFVQDWLKKAEQDIKTAEKAFQEAQLVKNAVLKRLKEYLSKGRP